MIIEKTERLQRTRMDELGALLLSRVLIDMSSAPSSSIHVRRSISVFSVITSNSYASWFQAGITLSSISPDMDYI